jgi:antirestriction protein ArdC
MKQNELYQAIADKVLGMMEKLGTDWLRPFSDSVKQSGGCYNVITKKPYRGINQLLLAWMGYTSPAWASYDQWKAKGMPVRKDEKGSMIVYFKMIETKDIDPKTGEKKKIPMLKHYTVFNAEQCENYVAEPVEIVEEIDSTERCIQADEFFKKTGANVRYILQNRAYYCMIDDEVRLPKLKGFINAERYYSTLGHEIVHWTGHSSRLNRLKMTNFGSPEYAQEELVAELGAAFLCAQLGINNEPRADHATYLNSWMKALRNDKKCFVKACSQATKSLDFLNGLQ